MPAGDLYEVVQPPFLRLPAMRVPGLSPPTGLGADSADRPPAPDRYRSCGAGRPGRTGRRRGSGRRLGAPGARLGAACRQDASTGPGRGLLLSHRRRAGGRALPPLPGMASMSAPLASLLAEELRRHPEVAAQLAELLRPPDCLTEAWPPRLWTAVEAAAHLHVHPRTLSRAAAAGRVSGAHRVGRRWEFEPETLALAPPTSAKPSREPSPRPRSSSSASAAIRGNPPERATPQ
jgi:hypothetical protein